MKIRKLVTALVLAGAIVPTTQAALQLGQWQVDNGVINGNACPDTGSVVSCTASTLASGDGFLQQEITINDGTNITTYIRTIVADPNDTNFTNSGVGAAPSSLAYSDESIVMSGGTNSGILSRQTQSDAASGFAGSSELQMGWAGDSSGNNKVIINQSFTDYGTLSDNNPPSAANDLYDGDTFQNTFSLTTVTDSSGNKVGKSMSIDQLLEMGNYQQDNDTDVQRFVVEERQGTEVPSNGSLTVDVLQSDGSTVPTTVTWAQADDVMVAWLGQNVNIADPGAASTDLSKFGFERVTNITDDNEASTSSTTSTDVTATPFEWDATFGTAPTLPAIGSVPYP